MKIYRICIIYLLFYLYSCTPVSLNLETGDLPIYEERAENHYVDLFFDQESPQTRLSLNYNDVQKKISFSWQESDVIKLYFSQDNRLIATEHIVSRNDNVRENNLEKIRLLIPNEIDTSRPYDLYGIVGNATYQKQGSNVSIVYGNSRVHRRLQDLRSDIVLSFKISNFSSVNARTKMQFEGSVFNLKLDVSTANSTTLRTVQIKDKNLKLGFQGRSRSMLINAEGGEIPLQDRSTDVYFFVPTKLAARNVLLSFSLQCGDNELKSLDKDVSILQYQSGKQYVYKLKIFENVPYNIVKRERKDPAYYRHWLYDFPDETPLNDLFIPGTHDSGANGGNIFVRSWTKCQSLDIKGQLNAGVRVFDARVKESGGDLWIYHGSEYMGGNLKDKFLNPIRDFLRQNPSEFVILFYKREGGDINSYINVSTKQMAEYRDILYTGSKNTIRVKDLRGKILFITRNPFNRDYGYHLMNWGDNPKDKIVNLFSYSDITDSGVFKIRAQDLYKPSSHEEKLSSIVNSFKLSKDDYYQSNILNINYISYTYGSKTIWSICSWMNNEVANRINASKDRYRGFVMMDYAGDSGASGDKLIDAIIENNFK